MMRSSLVLLRAAVLIGSVAAVPFAAVGEPRPTNTFILVTAASTKPPPPPSMSPAGVGVPPAKPVVGNPYQVPLLQNAGTLRGTR